jgi:hypothetical protein
MNGNKLMSTLVRNHWFWIYLFIIVLATILSLVDLFESL